MIDGLHGNRSCVAQIMSDMGGLSEDNASRPDRAYSLMGHPRRTSAEEELDFIEDRLGTSTNRGIHIHCQGQPGRSGADGWSLMGFPQQKNLSKRPLLENWCLR